MLMELAKLSDSDLFDYFLENAEYSPDSPENSKYSICFGSRHLFSGDTAELKDKFFKAVRKSSRGK